jgi:peptide/nickel transport system substrate-binding protein
MEAVCTVPLMQNMQLWAWTDRLDLGHEVEGSFNLSPAITEKSHFVE